MLEETIKLKKQKEIDNILHNIVEKKMRNQNAKYVCMSIKTFDNLTDYTIKENKLIIKSYIEMETNTLFGLQIVLADLPENIVIVGE